MDSTILNLGEDLSGFLATLGQPIEQSAREMTVFELYRRSLVSSGKAGELLGIPRLEFIQRASELGIRHFRFTDDESQAGGSRREQASLSAGHSGTRRLAGPSHGLPQGSAPRIPRAPRCSEKITQFRLTRFAPCTRDLLPPHCGGHAGNCGYHLTLGALKALHRYFRTVRCCGGYSAKRPSRSSLWAMVIQQSAAPVWLKADR